MAGFIGRNVAIEAVGSVKAWTAETAPDGWLICDGSEVSRTVYSRLFSVIGVVYGEGDSSTTFNLPDTQAVSIKGIGTQEINGRTKTGPASLGEKQEDQMQRITGTLTAKSDGSTFAFFYSSSGAFSLSTLRLNRASGGTSSDGRYEDAGFNSADSPDARTSATDEGQTNDNSIGMNYIIKY